MDNKERKAYGGAAPSAVECVNPVRDVWRVRWDVRMDGDGAFSWMERDLGHKPAPEEARRLIAAWHNARTDERIRSGFEWNGAAVWLSTENQFNYKAAYDLAVQTGGGSLPVTFKLGTDDEPVYHEFASLDELADFYTKAMRHVQETLAAGWREKDGIDMADYGGSDEPSTLVGP